MCQRQKNCREKGGLLETVDVCPHKLEGIKWCDMRVLEHWNPEPADAWRYETNVEGRTLQRKQNRWATNPRSPKCRMIDSHWSIEGHVTSGGLLWKINTPKRKELGTSEDKLLKVGGPKSWIITNDLALGHNPWSHGLGTERNGIVPKNYCRAVKSSERIDL